MKIYGLIHKKVNYSWNAIFLLTYLSINIYIFFEWIFIITKPSFLSGIPFFQKAGVLFFTSSLLTLAAFVILSVIALPNFIADRKPKNILKSIGLLLPSIICASFVLLVIDNFTYTVFKFGIVSTKLTRVMYLLIFVLLLIYSYLTFFRVAESISDFQLIQKRGKWILLGLPILTILILGISFGPFNRNESPKSIAAATKSSYPNIILITSDGLDAQHTSLYGYERNTTPNLKEFLEDSLFAENAFTNSGSTAGSLISIYTGKYPTTTRVLYPPDILKGEDSIEHLPGILQSLGYYTAEFSYPYYADAYNLNLNSGFDVANGRSAQDHPFTYFVNSFLETNRSYFLFEISNRILDRLGHIFFIKDMDDLSSLANNEAKAYYDKAKLELIYQLFAQTKQPLFIHLHWMGTHGSFYYPETREFSKFKDIENQEEWDLEFYDDTILDFDRGVGELISYLQSNNQYDNSLIIISTDHGQNYVTYKKIPLIIHFPHGVFAGRVVNNVQSMDISPTILDFLDIEQPGWMEGESIIGLRLGNRPIFGFGINRAIPEGKDLVAYNIFPPFYQFGYISMVYCDMYFQLDLQPPNWSTKKIDGYSTNCQENSTISDEQAFGLMKAHLEANGFETSVLKESVLADIHE